MNIVSRLINCIRSNWRNAILVTLVFVLGLSLQPLYTQGRVIYEDFQLLEEMETNMNYDIMKKIERKGRDFLVLSVDVIDNPDGTSVVGTWIFMDSRQLSLFRTPEEQSDYSMSRLLEIANLTREYYPDATAYAVIIGRPREVVTTTGEAIQIFGQDAYIFSTTALDYLAEGGEVPASEDLQMLYENGLFVFEDLQMTIPIPSLLQRDSKFVWPWEAE